MNEVAEFTRYVGVIVLVGAAVLLSPRGAVALWAGALRWVWTRWSRDPDAPIDVPVVVHARAAHGRHEHPVEVLDADRGQECSGEGLRSLATDVVEGRAVALAITGAVLVELNSLVARLPSPVVLATDLALVLAVFLVMRKVIRDYPADRLAAALPDGRVGPWTWRGPTRPVGVLRPGGLGAVLPLVATVVALLWPTELGRWLAGVTFGSGEQEALAVAWACELLWILFVTWALSRPRPSPTLVG